MLLIICSVLIVAVCKTMEMSYLPETDTFLSAMDESDETLKVIPPTNNQPAWMIMVPIGLIFVNVGFLTLGSWTSRTAR